MRHTNNGKEIAKERGKGENCEGSGVILLGVLAEKNGVVYAMTQAHKFTTMSFERALSVEEINSRTTIKHNQPRRCSSTLQKM